MWQSCKLSFPTHTSPFSSYFAGRRPFQPVETWLSTPKFHERATLTSDFSGKKPCLVATLPLSTTKSTVHTASVSPTTLLKGHKMTRKGGCGTRYPCATLKSSFKRVCGNDPTIFTTGALSRSHETAPSRSTSTRSPPCPNPKRSG